jgi:hypothetical protein
MAESPRRGYNCSWVPGVEAEDGNRRVMEIAHQPRGHATAAVGLVDHEVRYLAYLAGSVLPVKGKYLPDVERTGCCPDVYTIGGYGGGQRLLEKLFPEYGLSSWGI